MGNKKRISAWTWTYGVILAGLVLTVGLSSCGKKHISFTDEERKVADSIVNTVQTIDSLAIMQKQMENKGDKLGSIIALREWGKALRVENRFEEALAVHEKALKQTEEIGDTLEMVQILNNIGTNYRRLGVLDIAQEYHYRALKISEDCADTSFIAKKNLVVSLNGLGNIYMTLGNYKRADSIFRMALVGEKNLKSDVGQAINYANIGSIFEKEGKIDSAWVYYRHSMRCNEKAKSQLGISLCHTYFGSLYEKTKQYDKAAKEYETAYELMKASKDEWHALASLLALVEVKIATGKTEEQVQEYLCKAKTTAEKIKSKEHQAEVHHLYYLFYKKRGDYQQALAHHVKSKEMEDSIINMDKLNHMENMRLSIERDKQTQKINLAEQKLMAERTAKHIGYGLLVLAVIAFVIIISLMFYILRIRIRNHHTLKKMSRMRETFFTNITHEFRTPLTVILGLSQGVEEDGETTEKTREKMQLIKRQGNSLLTLINQLLDISKVKSAVGDPDWRTGNIIPYIGMIVGSYREYAQSRGIDINFYAKNDVEMDFVPDYISKVMNNLLSNAFKFTPQYGKVDIAVWSENEQLSIDISDTGEGIAQEEIAHIFEPFYQAESESAKIGTGIGLALVNQIMTSIGGKIEVESTLGKGTTFHIYIPIRHGNKRHAAIEDIEETNMPFIPSENNLPDDTKELEDSRRRVLIIEDNYDLAAYIGNLLTDNYAIFYATNGKDGIEKALEIVPDLIITDLMMPEMDGLEVCRRVRSNEVINHVPIIVVTAKISESDRVKGLEAGADAYLAKPFNSKELLVRVEKLLEQRAMLRNKYAQEMEDGKDAMASLADADQRFLLRVSDYIYLQLNKTKEVDIKQVASEMCMSYIQFYRKIVALTNYTPAAFILRIKIKKAQHMIEKNPLINFKDVAEQCGFSDYSNFVRSFKKTCGVSPSQYIRRTE